MKHKSNRKMIILTLLAVSLVFCGYFVESVWAATAVRVVAPTEVDPNVSTTFNASIIAEDISDPGFFGWEVLLSWTPGVINCTGETLNVDIWDGYKLGPWVPVPIDNVAGTYHQSLTGSAPGTPKSGTFWLVNLTFTVKSPDGTLGTDMIISSFPPALYCIADINAHEIPHELISGHVDVIPEFPGVLLLPILMMLSTASLILLKALKKHK